MARAALKGKKIEMKSSAKNLVIPMFDETKGNELLSFPILDVGDNQFILQDPEQYQK